MAAPESPPCCLPAAGEEWRGRPQLQATVRLYSAAFFRKVITRHDTGRVGRVGGRAGPWGGEQHSFCPLCVCAASALATVRRGQPTTLPPLQLQEKQLAPSPPHLYA